MSTFHITVPTVVADAGEGGPPEATELGTPGGATGTPATTAPVVFEEERRRFHPNLSRAGFFTCALERHLFFHNADGKEREAEGARAWAGGRRGSLPCSLNGAEPTLPL